MSVVLIPAPLTKTSFLTGKAPLGLRGVGGQPVSGFVAVLQVVTVVTLFISTLFV